MMLKGINYLLMLLCIHFSILYSQELKVKLSVYDGLAVVGYVNEGGFLNFTGPNLNLAYRNSKFIFGMLPSLRFKVDKGVPKNAFVTPNLGIGITYSYKILALQIPLYYTTKTATDNGNWHIGIGLGLRLNDLNTKK